VLFNSYSFLLLFLPTALAGFFLIGKLFGSRASIIWLILASIVFYASWEPAYTWLLLVTVGVNYSLAFIIQRVRRLQTMVVTMGILFNVLLLGYYKVIISGLFSDGETLSGAFTTTRDVLIPLGISFITFQQIAYLVDIYKGRFGQRSFTEYCLFITFFPQLVMGPIVHYRELVPQLQRRSLTAWNDTNFTIGLAIFTVGIFKKIVLGDGIAPYVNEVYSAAHSGIPISMVDAWSASIGFQFQIYFDFSGYADMAIGLGRMFNINLPLNFDSPYRAVDRFDLWRRWHISFGAFMRQYLYFPLARSKRLKIGSTMALLITTMVSGFWHGLGWTFILWGGLQGIIMTGSHYWSMVKRRWVPGASSKPRRSRWLAISLTFLVTLVLGVLFRSGDLMTAGNIYNGMIGEHAPGVPWSLSILLEKIPGVGGQISDGIGFHYIKVDDALLLMIMALIIWGLPNTRTVFRNYWSAIDQRGRGAKIDQSLLSRFIRFSPNLRWALLLSLLLAAAFVFMDGASRFIYYQF
jgi:alginate O-acetyltransferase complex protein AlgI